MSLAQLSRRTTVPKSTLFRILFTLQRRRVVVLDEAHKKYRLGIKLWELGNAFLSRSDLHRTAYPLLKQLAEASGESVFLGVMDEGQVLFVQHVESPRSVLRVRKLATRGPLHCTATGVAMLAYLPPEEVEQLLEPYGLQGRDPHAAAERLLLDRRMALVREKGFVVVDGEYNPELLCLSAPVLDEAGRPCAAMTVALLSAQQPSAERLEEVGALVRAAAVRLSQEIGYLNSHFTRRARGPEAVRAGAFSLRTPV